MAHWIKFIQPYDDNDPLKMSTIDYETNYNSQLTIESMNAVTVNGVPVAAADASPTSFENIQWSDTADIIIMSNGQRHRSNNGAKLTVIVEFTKAHFESMDHALRYLVRLPAHPHYQMRHEWGMARNSS